MKKIEKMETIAEIFDTIGGTTSVARLLGVGTSTASEIKRRGRIPSEYWRDIILAARNSGHPEITADLLVDLHARKAKLELSGLAEEERPFETPAAVTRADSDDKRTGHFSRFKHLRRSHFASIEEVNAHVSALRDEWNRR